MHDIVIVGLPILVILAGTLFNNRDIGRVETRLDARLDKIHGELTSLRSKMHREFEQFYRTLGQHDARIDNLEGRT